MINKYFQKHKERLGKEARERYQNLPEEVRDRKFKTAQDQERYQNLSEEEEEEK